MRRRALAIWAALLTGPAIGQSAEPLPPPRPAPTETIDSRSDGPGESGCLKGLRAAGHLAEAAPEGENDAPEACRVDNPVRLLAVAVAGHGKRRLTLPARPRLACDFAATLATWLGRAAAPMLEAGLRGELTEVSTGSGHECRTRNRQSGAQPSAHARGRALDLSGFAFADGKVIAVPAMAAAGASPDGTAEPAATLQAVRLSACGWFTTVLGPGSDAFHADHLHLDSELHGRSDRYRICQ